MPSAELMTCAKCGDVTHYRRISAPAPYMGERGDSPEVYGGRFDTMGYRKPPKLPTLESGANAMDYKYLFAKSEYKEVERERANVRQSNMVKRARARARRRGENVSVRRDRVAGDPAL
jgi:hypothetical protein